jgi:transposase
MIRSPPGCHRPRVLAGLEDWVAERFRRHAGNADVVRQELLAEKSIKLSLRTVGREVAPLRRELAAQARATVRFETPPGKQLQIDFGERRALIGGESIKVYLLFVATLGYSRRLYVRAFRNERQESWFAGLEGAFRRFGGVTEEVLFDNDRGLVVRHDRATREVEFNARLHAFARHWRFRPRACAPYRARTKGKDERGVGYVKKNAVAGRRFDSWAAFEAHLDAWTRDIADERVHGTTGEVPIERFRRAEAGALRPIASTPKRISCSPQPSRSSTSRKRPARRPMTFLEPNPSRMMAKHAASTASFASTTSMTERSMLWR